MLVCAVTDVSLAHGMKEKSMLVMQKVIMTKCMVETEIIIK